MSEGTGNEAVGTATARQDRIEFVRVHLGDVAYLLELGRVKRLVDDPTTTRVPRSPPAVVGVTAVGGDVVPVVEGRTVFGLSTRSPDRPPKLLVLDQVGDTRRAGLLVDEVIDIDTYHVDRVEPVAECQDWQPRVGREWFRAVVELPDSDDRSVGVLDLRTVVETAAERANTT